jgi:hypothetical protein
MDELIQVLMAVAAAAKTSKVAWDKLWGLFGKGK